MLPKAATLYTYRAVIVSVYDGDTLTVDIDLGFNTWMRKQKIRLYGIDTPEVRGEERPEGLEVKEFVLQMCPPGKEVMLESIKDKTGKYGRWLGVIHLPDGRELNQMLLNRGMAEKAYY